MKYDAIGYIYENDIFKVLVEDTDTEKQNVVDIAIIDHSGELVVEVAEPMDNIPDENDIVATALCYLDSEKVIDKYIDEETGKLRWKNLTKQPLQK